MTSFNDKKNIIPRLLDGSLSGVSIELGCGKMKRDSKSIGIDQMDFECVDIVGDAVSIIAQFPPCSVTMIESYHFMEHVTDFREMIYQCARILAEGGTMKMVVPHFSNPYFYSDYTHKTFFGIYSLSYFMNSDILKRVVPKYGNDLNIVLTDVKLVFRGERPFYIRHAVGLLLTKLINSTNYTKEFYEVNLSNLYSCHEIHFTVSKRIV